MPAGSHQAGWGALCAVGPRGPCWPPASRPVLSFTMPSSECLSEAPPPGQAALCSGPARCLSHTWPRGLLGSASPPLSAALPTPSSTASPPLLFAEECWGSLTDVLLLSPQRAGPIGAGICSPMELRTQNSARPGSGPINSHRMMHESGLTGVASGDCLSLLSFLPKSM